ncbi:hypothetical protein LPJ59_007145, partial [Coemansia sp. RSA 2399]
TILGGVSGDGINDIPVRVHKRIAMTPVGRPLRWLSSVYELVIVMADAMRCHGHIFEHCRILHRDISPNNILFTKDENNMVRGLLIDFDHSIDYNEEASTPHAERTGTLPFMSVANLERSENSRTALDDWESVIYMLCWFGVSGLNKYTRTEGRTAEHPQIYKWLRGNMASRAEEKRAHLDSAKNFSRITDEFDPVMDPPTTKGLFLSQLVKSLRQVLIDDHKNKKHRGALKYDPSEEFSVDDPLDSDSDFSVDAIRAPIVERIDPFAERVSVADAISQRLMRVLDKFARYAKKL